MASRRGSTASARPDFQAGFDLACTLLLVLELACQFVALREFLYTSLDVPPQLLKQFPRAGTSDRQLGDPVDGVRVRI